MIQWARNAMALCALTCCGSACTASQVVEAPANGAPSTRRPVPAASSEWVSADASGTETVSDETSAPKRPKQTTDRHGRPVPEEFACTVEFLEHLTRHHQAIASPDLPDALRPDLATLAAYFSATGVTFSGVDFAPSPPGAATSGRKTTRVVEATLEPNEIERQLRDRKGLAFFRLTKLGHDYSIRHPNHSSLTFKPTGDGVVVAVGVEGYELTFRLRGGCFLEEVHYLIIEAD